jgi:hypothetical protein
MAPSQTNVCSLYIGQHVLVILLRSKEEEMAKSNLGHHHAVTPHLGLIALHRGP